MEAQSEGGGSGGSDDSGGSNGGEVRRVYIIYFLSRKGRIEHPHLIRVHHLSRNGVRLRDVKRWLSELRGKDMPESFSWSYKRRYKTGHVWQDLVDEALITPISDNEYVLKGSEIPSTNFDLPSHGEEKDSMQKELHPDQKDARDHKWSPKEEIQEHPETTMDVLTKTSPEIEEEEEEESPPFGSETSTLVDDSMKLEEEKHSETNKQETQEQSVEFESSSSSSHSTLLNKKDRKKRNNIKVENPSSSSTWSSNMLRSFIKCGAVDTNDSATVMIKRLDKSSSYIPPTTTTTTTNVLKIKLIENENAAEICKGDKLGGSERIFGTTWNQRQQHPHPKARKSCDGMKSFNRNKSEFNNQNPVSTV